LEKTIDRTAPAKPFLKWAGGKGQLIEAFSRFYPEELKTGKIIHYYEPFIGGGAVFFDVAQQFEIKSATLYDINEELVLAYRVIQNDVDSLISVLEDFKKKYEKLNDEKRTEFYYGVRDSFNLEKGKINFAAYSKKWVKRAAQIIFLNRTCFNGLFRFNSKGEFNVPQGKYKNPKILDEQNLQKVSEILQIAEIKRADFSGMENDFQEKAFVYFDPPYRPISKTSGFTAYSSNSFGDAEQIRLAGLFSKLNKKGAKLMLSNSDPKNTDTDDNFFDDLYKSYFIYRIPAKRIINSNANKRHAINEIVVTNYPAV